MIPVVFGAPPAHARRWWWAFRCSTTPCRGTPGERVVVGGRGLHPPPTQQAYTVAGVGWPCAVSLPCAVPVGLTTHHTLRIAFFIQRFDAAGKRTSSEMVVPHLYTPLMWGESELGKGRGRGEGAGAMEALRPPPVLTPPPLPSLPFPSRYSVRRRDVRSDGGSGGLGPGARLQARPARTHVGTHRHADSGLVGCGRGGVLEFDLYFSPGQQRTTQARGRLEAHFHTEARKNPRRVGGGPPTIDSRHIR